MKKRFCQWNILFWHLSLIWKFMTIPIIPIYKNEVEYDEIKKKKVIMSFSQSLRQDVLMKGHFLSSFKKNRSPSHPSPFLCYYAFPSLSHCVAFRLPLSLPRPLNTPLCLSVYLPVCLSVCCSRVVQLSELWSSSLLRHYDNALLMRCIFNESLFHVIETYL